MIHSNGTLILRAHIAAVCVLFLFTASQSCASPRSRVHTTTRSAVATTSNSAKLSGSIAQRRRKQGSSPKYYLNVIGSSAREISVENTSGVAKGRVVLFTERRLGLYPKFWKGRRFNGGLPQLADLNKHLARVRRDVSSTIPDPDWDGFAVIDYEAWHLLWEYMPELYRDESRKVVRSAHPDLPETQVEEIARGQFENAAVQFITKTLDLCSQLRPKARWGMYGYPQTTNPARLKREAELYTHVDALYPSIYARNWSVQGAKPKQGQAALSRYKNRIDAIIGVSKTIAQGRPVLAYTWPRYNTSNPVYRNRLLNDLDLAMMLSEPLAAGADGVILWGGIMTHTSAVEYQRVFLDRMLPLVQTIILDSSDEATSSSAGDGPTSDAGTTPTGRAPGAKISSHRGRSTRRHHSPPGL